MRAGWQGLPAARLLAVVGLLSAQPGVAQPQVKSAQQIEQALGHAKTRGLVVMPGPEASEPMPERSTTAEVGSGSENAAAVSAAAAVDLNIPFAFNSSQLLPLADAQLNALQLALASPALLAGRFLVAGHTDGVGSAPYNRRLSLQRAQTVKRFLVAHGIAGERLQTAGYGADRLLKPDRPDDAINRRVEIRNLNDRR